MVTPPNWPTRTDKSLTSFAEIYMPLKRPLVPMHLFAERDFVVLTIISAVGGMLYYALNGNVLITIVGPKLF